MAEGPASGMPAGNKDQEGIHTVKELHDAEIEHTVFCWAMKNAMNLHRLINKKNRFGQKAQNPNRVKQWKAERELMRECSALEMKLKYLKSNGIDVAKLVGTRFRKYNQAQNLCGSDNASSVMSTSDDDNQIISDSENGSDNNLFSDRDNKNVTVCYNCNEIQNTSYNSNDDNSNHTTDKSTQTTITTDKSTQTATIESDNESGDEMFRSSAILMLSSLSLGSDSVFMSDEDAEIWLS